jgi:hypothetical protein
MGKGGLSPFWPLTTRHCWIVEALIPQSAFANHENCHFKSLTLEVRPQWRLSISMTTIGYKDNLVHGLSVLGSCKKYVSFSSPPSPQAPKMHLMIYYIKTWSWNCMHGGLLHLFKCSHMRRLRQFAHFSIKHNHLTKKHLNSDELSYHYIAPWPRSVEPSITCNKPPLTVQFLVYGEHSRCVLWTF